VPDSWFVRPALAIMAARPRLRRPGRRGIRPDVEDEDGDAPHALWPILARSACSCPRCSWLSGGCCALGLQSTA
jgi:hypothetical protein